MVSAYEIIRNENSFKIFHSAVNSLLMSTKSTHVSALCSSANRRWKLNKSKFMAASTEYIAAGGSGPDMFCPCKKFGF